MEQLGVTVKSFDAANIDGASDRRCGRSGVINTNNSVTFTMKSGLPLQLAQWCVVKPTSGL